MARACRVSPEETQHVVVGSVQELHEAVEKRQGSYTDLWLTRCYEDYPPAQRHRFICRVPYRNRHRKGAIDFFAPSRRARRSMARDIFSGLYPARPPQTDWIDPKDTAGKGMLWGHRYGSDETICYYADRHIVGAVTRVVWAEDLDVPFRPITWRARVLDLRLSNYVREPQFLNLGDHRSRAAAKRAVERAVASGAFPDPGEPPPLWGPVAGKGVTG